MIAVVAGENQRPVVREFFELFKTPWCFYDDHRSGDVLLCSNAEVPSTAARLVLIYERQPTNKTRIVSIGNDSIPIYCGCQDGEPLSIEKQTNGQTRIRFGFDLFAEVEFLLMRGQPVEFAMIPTLDLHIAILRELINRYADTPHEIRPVPPGYKFIACLTHDVDQPRLRHHFFDHTMFGFLFRALLGSLIDCARGRKSLRQLFANYRAALLLPFVYLRIARDPWDQFDRYSAIEQEASSTFFVIPFKSEPGEDADGHTEPKRAAAYDLTDIANNIRRLVASGREVAAHGIDAWRDARKGRAELERVRQYTDEKEIGVRMHWLYFGEKSFSLLGEAGYSYDSTVGYNGAVGYRAGTSQVFKPLGVEHLLELPMHVMDTALFFPSHMHLSPREAKARLDHLIANAERFGGVLTINWHDRSIAPERLWDDFYIALVRELKERGAWMPTAAEAVAWFRNRRESSFHEGSAKSAASVSIGEAAVHA
ncbi:MAG: hypothetical protein ACXWBS_02200 [Chthoniobacterales bacterium]